MQLEEDTEKYECEGDSRNGYEVSVGELCVVRVQQQQQRTPPSHYTRARVLTAADNLVKVGGWCVGLGVDWGWCEMDKWRLFDIEYSIKLKLVGILCYKEMNN